MHNKVQEAMKNLLQCNISNFLKSYGLIIIIFLIAPYYVLMPMFNYETWVSGHDSTGTVFNAWSMVKALREDFHLPLKWQAENTGYKGNPYWLFYQPLSYFVIYLLSLITPLFDHNHLFSAMKWSVYASFLISEIGMFLLLREIFTYSSRRNLISTFGSIIYLLAPYRFIDLYSRNAYSELWTFPWMPFYLLGFYKLFFLKEIKGWWLFTISIPLLFLSHLLPTFFFVMILHLGFLFFLFLKRNFKLFFQENKKILLWWFIGNAAGGILASFYVLPAMNIIKYLNGDQWGFDRVSLDNVVNHISWCYDMLNLTNFTGAWQVGQLFLIAFGVLLFTLFIRRQTSYKDLMIFLCTSLIFTFLFLMNKTLWEHMPKMFYSLQFSWRLFVVYSCLASVIIAILADEFKLKIPILIILIGFHFYTGERFLHYGGEDVTAKHFNTESWLNELYRKHFTTTNNYSPHSILPKTTESQLFSFEHPDKVGTNEKYSNTYLENLKPGINILSHQKRGNTFIYEFLADNSTFLIFKQYFYPSWELYTDSKKSNIYLTDRGYIGFGVPKGRHVIKIRSM